MISVIIPVYNNWELTRACLEALSTSHDVQDLDVIVVDNASSDATPRACPALGRRLFGARFRYLPQEVNRNFAGACNIGANAAQGDWLLLLNNDTLPLPGWAKPLLHAFAEDPHLGAAGPLLLYPPDKTGLHRVQHLGVVLSSGYRVSHLYEYLPEQHPVVSRSRRLQIITAAALFIPRRRYLALGGLDEGFINGFEDVEFCARLCREGLHQCVIPEARIIHLAGQSEGRRDWEEANSARCFALCRHLLHMDEPAHWRADGYQPELSPWLTLAPGLPPAKRLHLLRYAGKDPAALAEAVASEPLWQEGLLLLAGRQEAQGRFDAALDSLTLATRLHSSPDTLLPLFHFVCRLAPEDTRSLTLLREELTPYLLRPEERDTRLREMREELLAAGETELAEQAQALQRTSATFLAGPQLRLAQALQADGRPLPSTGLPE